MRQLHPRAVWILYTWYSSATVLFLPAVFFFKKIYFINNHFFWIPFVIVLVILFIFGLIFTYLWSKLAYKLYRFELTELGFKKEYGVIWKKYVTIPYDRIQNVDINRGIVARLLGLSDLHIQTAGSSVYGAYGHASEGRLPGLSVKDAEQLRDELIMRAHRKN